MSTLIVIGLTVLAYRAVLYVLSKSTNTVAQTTAGILGAGGRGEQRRV